MTPPSGAAQDLGPIVSATVVYPGTALYPGYHYAKDPQCIGKDVIGTVYKINPRTWTARDTGVVKVTPHVTYDDSGSTATFTGGTTLAQTYVVCAIKGQTGSTVKDSGIVWTVASPRLAVQSSTGNPKTIPPGEQRTFNFTVTVNSQSTSSGTLTYSVAGGATLVSSTARSVTVQATGVEGASVSVTATAAINDATLLDGSNRAFSTSASAIATATVDYDPITVDLSGLTETGVGAQCNTRYTGGAVGGVPPYTTSWETSGQINSQSDWEVAVGFPTVDEHYVYLQVTDSRGRAGGASVLVMTGYQYPCQW